MSTFGAVDLGLDALGRLDRAGGVVRELGRQLERDVPVLAVGGVVGRAQQVGAVADVGVGELEEDRARVEAVARRRAERAVVQIRVADGLLEDGRVRGHAADAVFGDQARELAGVEQFPADVVEPDRLAQRADGEQRVAHAMALPGRGSPASYPPMARPERRSLVNMSDVASRRSEYESAGLDVADLDRRSAAAVAALVRRGGRRRSHRAERHGALDASARTACPTCAIVLVRGVDERGLRVLHEPHEREGAAAGRASVGRRRPSAGSQLHRQVRVRGTRRARHRRRGRRLLRLAPARLADRRVGLAAEPRDRRPRRARGARARDRRALPGRGRAAARALGRLPHRARARSSSGRAGRAASTIACATAATARPGRSSASRPESDRRRAPHRAAPGPVRAATPCRG